MYSLFTAQIVFMRTFLTSPINLTEIDVNVLRIQTSVVQKTCPEIKKLPAALIQCIHSDSSLSGFLLPSTQFVYNPYSVTGTEEAVIRANLDQLTFSHICTPTFSVASLSISANRESFAIAWREKPSKRHHWLPNHHGPLKMMRRVKISQSMLEGSLLKDLTVGQQRYLYSIITIYNAVPLRRSLYQQHVNSLTRQRMMADK
ncbi:uncharacterized protein [Scyliorhinus torazame]|uniref:uncharacterized protein n=1 Tax=Scyliorhinus torazame TaxID=75743 RepID=UPI003B5C4BDA